MTWNTGGSPPFTPDLSTPTNTNEPYLVWLTYVLSQPQLPQVISTSYGDTEQTVPYSYAKRACAGFAQLGARGVSVLFSSGDSGVGSDGDCYSNTDPSKEMFLPAFPTSCPWVTSVGGTAEFEPEVAVSRFGSGAGFSNYFPAPSYQKKTVNAYIKSLNGLYDGLYNKTGRGYPDVAAQGNHDAIAWNGILRTVGGTSASSPNFAAVIALVNDALLSKGKPVLGFLNPWIYGGAYKALTDVVGGSSIGCNGTGFPAQAGWDAVTGFGTPVSFSPVRSFVSCGIMLIIMFRTLISWWLKRLRSMEDMEDIGGRRKVMPGSFCDYRRQEPVFEFYSYQIKIRQSSYPTNGRLLSMS